MGVSLHKRVIVLIGSLAVLFAIANVAHFHGEDDTSLMRRFLLCLKLDDTAQAQAREMSCSKTPTLHDFIQDEHTRDVEDRHSYALKKFDEYEEAPLLKLDQQSMKYVVTRVQPPGQPLYSKAACWRADNPAIFVGDHQSVRDMGTYMEPTNKFIESESRILAPGNYAGFNGWTMGNFGHFVHDHLPMIAWLREQVSADTRFILPYDSLHEEILETMDKKFVEDRVEWIKIDEVVQLADGSTLTLPTPLGHPIFAYHSFPPSGLVYTNALRRWLMENVTPIPANEKKIIFYSRNGGASRRVLDIEMEKFAIHVILQEMKRNNRTEELVIFNGVDPETGKTMAVRDQFNLFRSASAAIGPHGSGMTNVVWMNPEERACDSRPQVLEFISSLRTPDVHHGSPTGNYWFLTGGMPWLEYHHLMYSEKSTNKLTFIDMEVMVEALEAMWSPRAC